MRGNRERGRERAGGREREKGGDKGAEMERTRPATVLLKSGCCTKGSTLGTHTMLATDRQSKSLTRTAGKRLDGQDQKRGQVRGN